MVKILGISAFYHDAAAAIVCNGQLMAAAQEERFTRIKHSADFPINAINYCLEETGLRIDELDAVVFYDKPLLKFERLLQTYYSFAPKGLLSFLKAMPVWLDEKLFLKTKIRDGLKKIQDYDQKKLKLLFSTHHLSHAASAFYPSGFEKAALLTIDGVGEWCTASIGIGNKNSIRFIKELQFPHSVGLLYSSFTYFLGFKVNSGEYKLMGLAPYGNSNCEETKHFIQCIREKLVSIKEDGSIWMDPSFFNYATGLKMIHTKKWEQLFGMLKREEEGVLTQSHCNLAFAIQQVTEEIVVKMAREAARITGCNKLCLAGGVALNCVANGKLLKDKIFDKIYIQPAAGDAGGALGAALATSHIYFNVPRSALEDKDQMQGGYWGPSYGNEEVERMNKKQKASSNYHSDFENLCHFIAGKIAEGKIIGWFQNRMEFGPRALGNRSILADPRNPSMQKKLNLSIKYREGFRPFAPAILEEEVSRYFMLHEPSPYMLFVTDLKQEWRKSLPENYEELPLKERLDVVRSSLPAITHLDFSARVQTVSSASNPKFHQLLQEFNNQTGCPLLVNTSFNVRGEPMVCSPEDAFHCFMNTEMDYLVINNHVYSKKEQTSAVVKKYDYKKLND